MNSLYKKITYVVLGMFLTVAFQKGNIVYSLDNKELRGVWLTTAYALDWPSNINSQEQKDSLTNNFDFIKDQNMNTVFFQVRSMGDAYYKSSYAPWSKYLTGTLGKAPEYDPLQFAVEEAHKKGLKIQAWFNPFRIDSNAATFNKQDYINKLPDGSPLKSNPQWIVQYDKYHWLDIGIPEVREYVMSLIIEVVKNYNIDGIHLDDYFYPYPASGQDFPDEEVYKKYGQGFESKADWRRNNVNEFIKTLNTRIKQVKPSLKFGVSPFGIWKNGEANGGSATSGMSSYDAVYVDSKKWINEEWIDYIVPQIYWEESHKQAPYKVLVDWWAKQVENKDVDLYIGHAAYKVGDTQHGEAWQNKDELINQVKYAQETKNVKGSSFFSLRDLKANRLGVTDELKQLYAEKVPTAPDLSQTDWKDHWAVNEIKYAMDKGWVNKASTFRPNEEMTRAEFIKVVNKSFGFTSAVSTESFDDVKQGDWFYDEVRIALKAGYITSKNSTFRPNDQITREEVASIITSIKNNKSADESILKPYTDASKISSWAKTSVIGSIKAGYMGKGGNMFNPKNNITRAQAIVTLYRVHN